MSSCVHTRVRCLNQYELIRKYRCVDCRAVMMCGCDESRGRRFLSHQLFEGQALETGARVRVTSGFQPAICNECRGLPPAIAPTSAIPGRTSKISRYYWRELAFRGFEILSDWEERNPSATDEEHQRAAQDAERQALDEIKSLHAQKPKYDMRTESEADFLRRLNVSIENARARSTGPGRVVCPSGSEGTAEDFATEWFEQQGYRVIATESEPFHALFAVFMWVLIEDPEDPLVDDIMFGERSSEGMGRSVVTATLPRDFGKPGYATRRAAAVQAHLESLPTTQASLEATFDFSLEGSTNLRQYLWAHSDAAMQRARSLLPVLGPDGVRRVLAYLVKDYWGRYVGWPDLVLSRGEEIRFVEVKLGSDKLSDEQRRWIELNGSELRFGFSLLKIHRE
jgi:VRR-NUC domain